jgi:hypothetical protein
VDFYNYMSRTSIAFVLDVVTSYVSFGLALYAGGALAASIWMRRRPSATPKAMLTDLSRAYGCMIVLVLLEAVQQLWDSFHAEHLPLSITRAVLPVLYLVLGNSVFRLIRQKFRDFDPSKADDHTLTSKAA